MPSSPSIAADTVRLGPCRAQVAHWSRTVAAAKRRLAAAASGPYVDAVARRLSNDERCLRRAVGRLDAILGRLGIATVEA
ncbi:MAG: hypothetical protein ACI9MR_000041 [Myxococcota bacterium]|jgi:hypothetical protein